MKQLLIYILAVWLLHPTILMAKEDNNQLWQKANNAYLQKDYETAVAAYLQIAKQQPKNAEVFYNLGNTYYRLNDVGNSVLNYERALKIKPGHKAASDNLYLAQNRINNRIQGIPEIFFVRWWHYITPASMANVYAVVAAILFFIVMIYFTGKRLGKIQLSIPGRASAAIVIICLVFVTLGLFSAFCANDTSTAIVMKEGAAMMTEPKYGKSQSLIPAGTKVSICSEQSTWLEVILPDGRTGWMQQDAVVRI